jgi:hypothetical protein
MLEMLLLCGTELCNLIGTSTAEGAKSTEQGGRRIRRITDVTVILLRQLRSGIAAAVI